MAIFWNSSCGFPAWLLSRRHHVSADVSQGASTNTRTPMSVIGLAQGYGKGSQEAFLIPNYRLAPQSAEGG